MLFPLRMTVCAHSMHAFDASNAVFLHDADVAESCVSLPQVCALLERELSGGVVVLVLDCCRSYKDVGAIRAPYRPPFPRSVSFSLTCLDVVP